MKITQKSIEYYTATANSGVVECNDRIQKLKLKKISVVIPEL